MFLINVTETVIRVHLLFLFGIYVDCTELYKIGQQTSGVYTIHPDGSPAFSVYCDMTHGGWTVFMRRFDGSQDFFLFWRQYKEGFGNVSGEYWLGNEKLYHLTNQNQYNMKMDATLWSNGVKKFATYQTFRVQNEGRNYRLQISGYSGNTEIDHWAYHNGQEFSTRDRDYSSYKCTQGHKGAHWYSGCYRVNPTGLYKPTGDDSMNLWYNGRPQAVSQMTLKIKRV